MGYRKFRDIKQHLRNYVPPQTDRIPRGYLANDEGDDVAERELVTADELSVRSGASKATIYRMVDDKVLPRPVGFDRDGHTVFDIADPKLSAWVEALQRAGYNRKPVNQ
ncbi:MAG: hypothetical protein B7Z73_05490 [Planctomycetia bacterium 21-64-5]|nr:MAG: hypothetical protein B7Z73_05490 [Planctomycetia bacterium 21-64-5]HQU42130.1 hypothetical protein [Pirellulales bacterium]